MTDRDDFKYPVYPRTQTDPAQSDLIRARARIDDLQKQLEVATELAAAKGIAAAKSADALAAITADRDGLLLGLAAAELELDRLRSAHGAGTEPIPMLLRCPACRTRHIDAGRFATKPHHTHACQECGEVWRPAVVHTVGVKYLPGFKDEPDADRPCGDPACPWCPVPAGG